MCIWSTWVLQNILLDILSGKKKLKKNTLFIILLNIPTIENTFLAITSTWSAKWRLKQRGNRGLILCHSLKQAQKPCCYSKGTYFQNHNHVAKDWAPRLPQTGGSVKIRHTFCRLGTVSIPLTWPVRVEDEFISTISCCFQDNWKSHSLLSHCVDIIPVT